MRALCTRHGATVKAPTERQRACLSYIHESLTKRGYSPTHQELAERFGVAGKGAATSEYFNALVRKGLLERAGRGKHGMKITDAGLALLGEPTPAEMRAAVKRSERARGLLIRCWSLLTQVTPAAPLLAEIRDELGIDERMSTAPNGGAP